MRANLRTCSITVLLSKGCSAVIAGVLLMWLTIPQSEARAVPFTTDAQQFSKRITNQDVVDMVSFGLSDDVIIDKIHATTRADFDTSITGLRALKAARVSDAVIRVMINPTAKPMVKSTDDAALLTPEVGVYIVRDSRQTEVPPEIVNWQTGGVLKTHASLGIVKGDVNGKVMRGRSSTRTTSPVEFLIRTPEGTSVEEYQLLRLHEKSNRREFRSVTGGVLHVSGGAQRDEVAFEAQKAGNRVWKIVIGSLPNGEYGFLPPGVASASISASGKMYTFGVIEGNRSLESLNTDQNQESAAGDTAGASTSAALTMPALGISTRDGNDGAEIIQIAHGSAAELSGMHVHYVINAVDGKRVRSMSELEAALANRTSGGTVRIGYMFHSNLGWMPGAEKVLTLEAQGK